MPLAPSSLTQGHSTSTASSYATASITPTANALVLAAVLNTKASAPTTPTLSGNGLTWVQVATLVISLDTGRLTIFRALGASPSAGVATVDFGGVSQTSCSHKIQEWPGVNTGGTNGSSAVVQAVSAETVGTQSDLTLTLAAWADAVNNAATAFFFLINARTFTAETGNGWAQLAAQINGTGPTSTLADMWKLGQDTTATGSVVEGPVIFAGIAIEIAAAAAAGGKPWYAYVQQ